MPAFSDYSAIPANNVNVGGLSMAEGATAVASLNNAVRELAANGRQLYDIVVGLPNPLAGGAFTGDISRQGRGAYVGWNSATLTSGRMFVITTGAPDPTTTNGEILFEIAP